MTKYCPNGHSNNNNARQCQYCKHVFGEGDSSIGNRRCGRCGGMGAYIHVWGMDTCEICGGTGWV